MSWPNPRLTPATGAQFFALLKSPAPRPWPERVSATTKMTASPPARAWRCAPSTPGRWGWRSWILRVAGAAMPLSIKPQQSSSSSCVPTSRQWRVADPPPWGHDIITSGRARPGWLYHHAPAGGVSQPGHHLQGQSLITPYSPGWPPATGTQLPGRLPHPACQLRRRASQPSCIGQGRGQAPWFRRPCPESSDRPMGVRSSTPHVRKPG